MRILFFAHETTWSGAPVQLLHLARWLKQHGCEVAVAVPKADTAESGPISAELARSGIQLFPLLDLAEHPAFQELESLCAQFDVVVANTLTMWAAVRAAHARGIPAVWYIHESLVAEQLFVNVPEIRPTLKEADVLVMPTYRTAELYRGLTEQPIDVVPYGIPIAGVNSVKQPRDRSVRRFLLLGTYEPRKGQDLYLQAIAQLSAVARSRSVFQMAGRILDQSFYNTLVKQAASLPNVRLLGALTHDEATGLIVAADVVVCASRDETMPIALLEAMSVGKAVVSTDTGGIAEWLRNGENALLVPPDDIPALRNALERCLNEPGLIEALGENARETFANNFSLEKLGERFLALLEVACSRKKDD